MSYFCADTNGYLDDVASIGGLADFRRWAHLQGGIIHTFVDKGHTSKPQALAEALAAASADGPVESTRQGILACAQQADGMLILADGMTDIGDEPSLDNEVEKYADDQPRDEHGRWSNGGGESAPAASAPTNYHEFEQQALSGLAQMSRTAHGEYDRSSSEDKPDMAVSGAALAEATKQNFKNALHLVWTQKDAGFQAPGDVHALVSKVGETLTHGLIPRNELLRTFDAEHYTPAADVPASLREFSQALQARLSSHADAIDTAAMVEQEFNGRIHPWSDSVGRGSRVLAALALARGGQPLPHYPPRDEFYAHINGSASEWRQYYRTLFPKSKMPSGGPFVAPSQPGPPKPGWMPSLPDPYKETIDGDALLFSGLVKAAINHHEPELQHALLQAWKGAAMGVSGTEVRVGVREKDPARVAAALARGNLVARVREVVEPRAASAYLRGVQLAARPLRRIGIQTRSEDDAVEKGPTLSMGRMNPHAAHWASERAGELVLTDEETQGLIRQFIEDAVTDGFSPDEVADLIEGIIGLDERRSLALQHYGADLHEEGVTGEAWHGKVDIYAEELLRSRAETIARTEILMATNAGQQGLWNEALSEGLLDAGMRKVWIVTDDETLCDECNAMGDADPVGIDEAFDSEDDFPPLHPNCRCTIGLVGADESAPDEE